MREPGRGLRALLLLLLLPPAPAGAWYKQAAGPRYHTVGRAAGLLTGPRRPPDAWRRALRPSAAPPGAPARPARPAGPSVRAALPLPLPLPLPLRPGARGLREPPRGAPRAEFPGRAPWSPRAPEPAPGAEPRPEAEPWPSQRRPRAFAETRAPPRPPQRAPPRPGPARP